MSGNSNETGTIVLQVSFDITNIYIKYLSMYVRFLYSWYHCVRSGERRYSESSVQWKVLGTPKAFVVSRFACIHVCKNCLTIDETLWRRGAACGKWSCTQSCDSSCGVTRMLQEALRSQSTSQSMLWSYWLSGSAASSSALSYATYSYISKQTWHVKLSSICFQISNFKTFRMMLWSQK